MRWEIDHMGYKMCEHSDIMLWIKGIIGVLIIALLVVLLVRLVRHGGKGCPLMNRVCGMGDNSGRSASALTLLEERYARGEIGTDEFAERKKELEK
jgi:putative membrane protein